jgi:hypothetical protein
VWREEGPQRVFGDAKGQISYKQLGHSMLLTNRKRIRQHYAANWLEDTFEMPDFGGKPRKEKTKAH